MILANPTNCPNGHAMTKTNTFTRKGPFGKKYNGCRECFRLTALASRSRTQRRDST